MLLHLRVGEALGPVHAERLEHLRGGLGVGVLHGRRRRRVGGGGGGGEGVIAAVRPGRSGRIFSARVLALGVLLVATV